MSAERWHKRARPAVQRLSYEGAHLRGLAGVARRSDDLHAEAFVRREAGGSVGRPRVCKRGLDVRDVAIGCCGVIIGGGRP
jgi:hypothetical protein